MYFEYNWAAQVIAIGASMKEQKYVISYGQVWLPVL
jgi:hypothetical protein